MLDDIEYLRKCIDVLEKDPELFVQTLSNGRIPANDPDVLISKFVGEQKPDMVALILQKQQFSAYMK